MNILCYGNCQIKAVGMHLKFLRRNHFIGFSVSYVDPRTASENKDRLHELAKQTDVLIFQTVRQQPNRHFSVTSDYICKLVSGIKIRCTNFWLRQFLAADNHRVKFLLYYFKYIGYTPSQTYALLTHNSNTDNQNNEAVDIQTKIIKWINHTMVSDMDKLKCRELEDSESNKQLGCINASILPFIEQQFKKNLLGFDHHHVSRLTNYQTCLALYEILNLKVSGTYDVGHAFTEPKYGPTSPLSFEFIKNEFTELHYADWINQPVWDLNFIESNYQQIEDVGVKHLHPKYQNQLIHEYFQLK